MFGNVIIDKKTIEHTSLFIFDLAIRHTVFVSA